MLTSVCVLSPIRTGFFFRRQIGHKKAQKTQKKAEDRNQFKLLVLVFFCAFCAFLWPIFFCIYDRFPEPERGGSRDDGLRTSITCGSGITLSRWARGRSPASHRGTSAAVAQVIAFGGSTS